MGFSSDIYRKFEAPKLYMLSLVIWCKLDKNGLRRSQFWQEIAYFGAQEPSVALKREALKNQGLLGTCRVQHNGSHHNPKEAGVRV